MIRVIKTKRSLTKASQQRFIRKLDDAVNEKDVENAYRAVLSEYYDSRTTSPHGCDGYIELNQTSLLGEDMRLLLEAKYGLDLTKPNERAKIIAQSIYYLKKFQATGVSMPNVVMGGDENQMFTIYVPNLAQYLDRDYDWSIAPSDAWRLNSEMYLELIDDPNLNAYVFDIHSSAFDMNQVFQSIDVLAQQKGEFIKLRVTEQNLRLVFDEFVRLVFGETDWLTGMRKIGADESVSIFVRSILADPETYIVPTKKNILHLGNGKEVRINASNYFAFFSRYDRNYTAREIDTITAIADQLIEEVKRRFHGDFWTPTIWADRAIQMITDDLGDDWRDRYVVWDPAAGTKNLTRDYRFKNLFSSTIHQSEIDMSRQYNQEATSFQYDFLNDDIDVSPDSDPRLLKMPLELFTALKNNEPIVFYTNPPYGQATNAGVQSKTGIAATKIGEIMNRLEYRKASAELYTQFFFRVQKLVRDFGLTDARIFFFSKVFQISPVYYTFVDEFFDQFDFKDGFLINAGEFQGTSSVWGIVFSHFALKTSQSRQHEFEYSIEFAGVNGIEKNGTHVVRRINKGDSIKDWLYEIELPKTEYNDGKYPRTSGGVGLSSSQSMTGTYRSGSFGLIQFNSPNVQHSDKYLSLNGSMIGLGNTGRCITPDNFERACTMFSAVKSTRPDASWVNDKDVFRRPSDEFQSSDDWREFVHDCVVLALFHRASYQTSLRGFEYNGELYDVANEWFYMSRDEIVELAEKHHLNGVVYDARSSDDRLVYKYLLGKHLSDEARALLEAGRRLTRQTFARREMVHIEHPEWHLMTWDAGYYQVYKITTQYSDEFGGVMSELSDARGRLETKIREQVYRDGILNT